jgi:hypothetical protein
MSVNIELYKYNWDRLTLSLRGLGIEDTELLGKILLEFGERCGNRYYILNNEYYDEYNSYYNVISFIRECFNIEDDHTVHSIFMKNRKPVESAGRSELDVQDRLGFDSEWNYF